MRGLLIAIEGADASGKSTLVANLKETLGDKVSVHRQPGGTEIAEKIRSIFLENTKEEIGPYTELYLISAARDQLYNTVVRAELEVGQIVVLDRHILSTHVYQGELGAVPHSLIERLGQTAFPEPDLTIFLDVSREVAQSRLISRNQEQDRVESKESAGQVVDAYKRVTKMINLDSRTRNGFYRNPIEYIDANQSENAVYLEVLGMLQSLNKKMN